jgi:hypothetical protein
MQRYILAISQSIAYISTLFSDVILERGCVAIQPLGNSTLEIDGGKMNSLIQSSSTESKSCSCDIHLLCSLRAFSCNLSSDFVRGHCMSAVNGFTKR